MKEKSCTLQSHTARLSGRTITVEELVPQLESQEYDERIQAIEAGLYDIFIQYEEKAAGA